jgi:hypothetical protein
MRYAYSLILLFIFSLMLASCAVNLFSPLAAKDYPEANQYQSQNLIDQGKYDEILKDPDKYPAQDNVAAALGIMGFDLKLLTNFLKPNNNSSLDILLGWVNIKDTNYIKDLGYALKRLRNEYGSSIEKSITLSLAGSALSMLGLLILADIANTNAINTSDGINENEIDVLSYWLSNPPDNLTNLFRRIGDINRDGQDETIAGVIGGGYVNFFLGLQSITSLSPELTNASILTNLSNIISSLDPDGDGIISDNDVTNFIVSFLSNLTSSSN